MKRKMNINNIFKKLLFTFICIFAVGVMNVNALTVEVSNESQLKAAVDGQKEVDGVDVNDTDTNIVKLVADIELTSYLEIVTITDLTLDLNGHTINGETNSQSVGVTYGSNGLPGEKFTSGSLTIKDSSSGKLGKIISNKTIWFTNGNLDTTSTKNFKFTVESGNFKSLYVSEATLFTLNSSDNYMKNKNITFDFQIKDGYFEVRGSQAILFYASDIDANNVTLNVNYDKLTFKGDRPRLVYSYGKNFTVNDVVSADSKIKLKHSTLNTEGAFLTDRTLSVTELNAFSSVIQSYDTIEITKTEGFDVENVTLNETYGYTAEGATAKGIAIKNRGTSNLQIKNVTVSGGTSSNFIITGTAQPTLAAGATDNTSYSVKPKPGLNAGTYTETITVTDMANKTYTATVTLIVAKKVSTGVSIDMQSFMYGETPSVLYVDYGDLQTGQYKIEYSVKDANDWKTTAPTKAGIYTVKLSITDDNLLAQSWAANYEIRKNNKEIQIIANSEEFTYDGNDHTNTGYVVKYNGEVVTGGVLPTGDTVTAVISGSVKDVKDTVIGNNVVTSYTITDSNGVDSANCYITKTKSNGTLTVKPITTEIVVTAGSDTKAYDGSALTKDSFTNTEGVLLNGDTLTATITGEQKYVGTSSNTVSNVKVMRGDKDITSNYTFGTHINGTLTVTAVDQPLSIADQYVRVNGKLFTSELEDALTGAKGNVSFEKKSGTAGEYNKDTIGGFLAGSSVGTVVMTVKATAYDENNDGTVEYNETEKDFNIHVVTKETVTISGITDNQEFTYDGNTHTPTGTIAVSGDKVLVSDLEVSYAGTGSTTYSSTTAPKNAGTYKVTYKVPNTNANYVGEATFNFTIKKAQLPKVTLKKTSYEYTGEEFDLEFNDFNGLYMSLLGSFGEFVPIVKNVKTYNFSVSLRDKNNYEWADGTTDDIPLTISVTKADPSYEELVPTNLTGLKGQKLSDITLPSGFTWNNASTPLIVGTHTYKATYTPSDTNNYNVIDNIDITVVTKDIFNVTTSVTSGEGTINGPFMNVVEGTKKEIIFTPETGFMIDKVKINGTETTVTDNKITLTINEDKNIEVSYKKIPFTITVVDTKGATVTPDGIVTVNYGETQEFTITTNSGYRFIKVLVNNVDKTEEMTGDKLTLNNITDDVELKVVVERIVYEVIEGDNQKYTITKDKDAKFRIDAEYGMFEDGGKVYVDDKLVDEENYTSEEGSTIITLKQSFVDTLSVGSHTLKVVFADDGIANANFTVAKITSTTNNPQTGDNIGLYITLCILSVIGLIGASVFVIKRKQEN